MSGAGVFGRYKYDEKCNCPYLLIFDTEVPPSPMRRGTPFTTGVETIFTCRDLNFDRESLVS